MYVSTSLIECLAHSRYSTNVEQMILSPCPFNKGALFLLLLSIYTLLRPTKLLPVGISRVDQLTLLASRAIL